MQHARRRSSSALGLYLGITIVLVVILGNEGKNEEFQPQNEFKLDPWIEIDIGGIDFSINKAVLYLLLASALTIVTMTWIARRMQREPNKVQMPVELAYDLTAQQHHRGATSATARRWRSAGSRSSPASSSSSGSRT